MIRHIALLLATSSLVFVAFYVSRFWNFRLWERPGLFGLSELPPQGGLVARWLRGSDFSPFELIIWALVVFLVLTLFQKLLDQGQPK